MQPPDVIQLRDGLRPCLYIAYTESMLKSCEFT